MSIEKLFKVSYLFDITPGSKFQYTIEAVIFFVLLLASGIVLRQYLRQRKDPSLKKVLKRYPGRLYAVSLIGLLIVILRTQGIPLFSMRFLFILDALIGLALIGKAWYLYKKVYPKEQAELQEKMEKKKYFKRRGA